jgi:hypothetical protein
MFVWKKFFPILGNLTINSSKIFDRCRYAAVLTMDYKEIKLKARSEAVKVRL